MKADSQSRSNPDRSTDVDAPNKKMVAHRLVWAIVGGLTAWAVIMAMGVLLQGAGWLKAGLIAAPILIMALLVAWANRNDLVNVNTRKQ